jgi:hypothetical protein
VSLEYLLGMGHIPSFPASIESAHSIRGGGVWLGT